MNRILAGLLALALWASPSFAQAPPSPPAVSVLAGQVALSVTNATARVALPSTAVSALAVTIYNKGSKDAYFKLGSSSVTAATTDTQIPAGTFITVWINGATNVASITGGADTTTLVIYQGTGPLQFGSLVAPQGAAPTGAAGGDLSGTYPNPSVVSYNGGTAFGTAAAASTGTSGVTIPLLNGTNTWSGAQAFTGPTLTYNVGSGGDYATLTAAFAAANQMLLPVGSSVTLQVMDVGTTEPGTIYAGSIFGKQITVVAQHNYSPSITSVQSSSGSAGAWSIVLNVSSVANLTTAMDVAITAVSGGSNPTRLAGVWPITNVDAVNTRITVTSKNRAAAAPSGAVIGTITALPRINVSGADGIDVWNGNAVLNVNGVSIVGNGAGSFAGLSIQDLGRVYVSSILGVRNFGGDGVLLLYNSQLNSGGTVLSTGNGDDGFKENWGGSYDAINTVASGNTNNGFTALGGGNVSLSDTGSASVISGNGNVGAIATNGAVITTGATASNDNGTYGYNTSSGGYINIASATATGNATAQFGNLGVAGIPYQFQTQNGVNAAIVNVDGSSNGHVTTYDSGGNSRTDLGESAGASILTFKDTSAANPATISYVGSGQMCMGTTATTCAGAWKFGALISAGSTPTLTGTCTTGSQAGGNTAGTFTATCAGQTVIITFATTAPTGWNCNAHDRTTPADALNQTASSTTSCTLTGTTVAADVISFDARAY